MMKKNKVEDLKGDVKQDYPWWDPSKVDKEISLHLSIPSYDSKLSINLDNSLRQAFSNSKLREKLRLETSFVSGDSLICRARDKMAANFLASDCEWQLQIDSDIVFPFGLGKNLAEFYSNWMDTDTFEAFMNEGIFRLALSINAIDEILRSALSDGHTMVGGLYFWRGGRRNLNETSSIIPLNHSQEFGIEFKLTPDNYIPTDKLATGFLLTHRSVYEDIKDNYPELEYTSPTYIPGKPTTAFYTPIITPEEEKLKDGSIIKKNFYRSEDYAFSWRAAQSGHKPVINMNILLGHIGEYIYSWFDRPILQKVIYESFNNPRHFVKKDG